MPRNVIQYDLLISCPGDIKEELSLIEQAVNEFNTMFSDTLGIPIQHLYFQTILIILKNLKKNWRMFFVMRCM